MKKKVVFTREQQFISYVITSTLSNMDNSKPLCRFVVHTCQNLDDLRQLNCIRTANLADKQSM